MSVRCAKCGEELLGAVNRCWKCGQAFARRPDADGLPPVRLEWESQPSDPLDAVVIEDSAATELEAAADNAEAASVAVDAPSAPLPPVRKNPLSPPLAQAASPYAIPRPKAAAPATSQMVEARRQSLIAMSGTVTSLLLGVFGVTLAFFRFEGAIVALIGLLMGVWGLYSQKRKWALLAMLLCILGISLGTYRGVSDLYIYIKDGQTTEEFESGVSDDPNYNP